MRVHGVDVTDHVRWKTSTTPGTSGRQARTRVSPATQKSYKTAIGRRCSMAGMDTDSEPIRFDTKIAVLLRDDLEAWQRLNVTAFLVSGIGPRSPEVIGEPCADADGTEYLPMFRQPVLVFEASKETLARACESAVSRGVALSVFTADLFATGNDRDNRAAVRAGPGRPGPGRSRRARLARRRRQDRQGRAHAPVGDQLSFTICKGQLTSRQVCFTF